MITANGELDQVAAVVTLSPSPIFAQFQHFLDRSVFWAVSPDVRRSLAYSASFVLAGTGCDVCFYPIRGNEDAAGGIRAINAVVGREFQAFAFEFEDRLLREEAFNRVHGNGLSATLRREQTLVFHGRLEHDDRAVATVAMSTGSRRNVEIMPRICTRRAVVLHDRSLGLGCML